MLDVADTSVNDVALDLLQKMFTKHPQLEQDMVERLSA
jgi:electron transfer flavoprotein beta subunit